MNIIIFETSQKTLWNKKYVPIHSLMLRTSILKYHTEVEENIFLQLSPLWKSGDPLFKQIWFTFTHRSFAPSLIEIGQILLEKKIWKICQYIAIIFFGYHLPLKKGKAFHFNKYKSLSPRDTFCQVLLKLALWFLRRKWKYEKFTTTTTTTTTTTETTTTDNGPILIRKARLSLRLRWANETQF